MHPRSCLLSDRNHWRSRRPAAGGDGDGAAAAGEGAGAATAAGVAAAATAEPADADADMAQGRQTAAAIERMDERTSGGECRGSGSGGVGWGGSVLTDSRSPSRASACARARGRERMANWMMAECGWMGGCRFDSASQPDSRGRLQKRRLSDACLVSLARATICCVHDSLDDRENGGTEMKICSTRLIPVSDVQHHN